MEFNKKQTHQILPYTSLDAYLYLEMSILESKYPSGQYYLLMRLESLPDKGKASAIA